MQAVNADELIRSIKKSGRRNKVRVSVVSGKPRGGHVTVYYGEFKAVVPVHRSRKELPTGTVRGILKALGL